MNERTTNQRIMLRQSSRTMMVVAMIVVLLLFVLSKEGLSSEKQQKQSGQTSPPRIAIIGGGLGGTSCAYFLRELFGQEAHITVYERDAIGGRLATVSIAGKEYEIGGSIIHPKNMYMNNFVTKLGLKKRPPTPSTTMGIYNGQEFVFTESSWTIITLLKLLWRYGLDVFRLQWTVQDTLTQFANIYDYQDSGQSFTTIEELLSSMGGQEFLDWLTTPVESVLKAKGFSDRFINEIVSIATRVNYGQSTQMSAFAGMVSLAGAQPGLWSIEGGNHRVPEELLKKSGASFISASVTQIQRNAKNETVKPTFDLTYTSSENNTASYEIFDIVVLATPLQAGMSSIQFTGFDPPIRNTSGQYRHTVATLVKGHVNGSTFAPGKSVPDEIITNVEIPWNFRSVSPNFPVRVVTGNDTTDVFKVFSTKALNETQMRAIFASYSDVIQRDWLAYPYYLPRTTFPSFVLSDGAFYCNAVEWAASAMEMSVIGGRNVALLTHKYWMDDGDARMTEDEDGKIKQEL